ncbi:hypothetical protein PRIPAC_76637 [Pristionchus pacificus]|uniref:G protein-coupled receptor n=1 Tax=Pristionchus pacificus TaxID=54126 RepID=A0A2A6C6M1_PRIPA|nr:hypothetical protein PRIPAC_76637 [Pristionchus pacificus]|eukprot:PDM73718.1 G protein-coupled receptor [Pristionchus pacificus]
MQPTGSSNDTLSLLHEMQNAAPTVQGLNSDRAEIIYLGIVGTVATVLNSVVFLRLIRQSRTPTARTSFTSGPYHISSFTLFKLNLCITDFLILLIHTFGKIIWIYNYSWPWGDAACRTYQFLSIFSYYSNSNVIVAIGVDRLKVVYTSHIQGATSVRRVRTMLAISWILAAACAAPQVFLWEVHEVSETFSQCASIFLVHNASVELSRAAIAYEIFHYVAAFWIPFVILSVSYLMIVMKLIHFTFKPVSRVNIPKASTSVSSTTRLLNMLDAKRPDSYHFQTNGSIALEPLARSNSVLTESTGISSSRSKKKMREVMKGKFAKTNIICTMHADAKGVPLWRKQLRSRVFLTALIVVVAHVAMWAPYNFYSMLRIINHDWHESLAQYEVILEDLIVMNSLVNPILYSFPCRV